MPSRDREAESKVFSLMYLKKAANYIKRATKRNRVASFQEILEWVREGMPLAVKHEFSDSDVCIKTPGCVCIHFAAAVGPCAGCVHKFIGEHSLSPLFMKALMHFGALVDSNKPLPESDADWEAFLEEVENLLKRPPPLSASP